MNIEIVLLILHVIVLIISILLLISDFTLSRVINKRLWPWIILEVTILTGINAKWMLSILGVYTPGISKITAGLSWGFAFAVSFISYFKVSIAIAKYVNDVVTPDILIRFIVPKMIIRRVKTKNRIIKSEIEKQERLNIAKERIARKHLAEAGADYDDELEREKELNKQLRKECAHYKRIAEGKIKKSGRAEMESGRREFARTIYGIPEGGNATKEDLDRIRTFLVKRLHPDTSKNEEETRILTELSKTINYYHDILLNEL